MPKEVAIRAHVNTFTGFGQLLCEIVAGLDARGWSIQIQPLQIENDCRGIPARVPLEIVEKCKSRSRFPLELILAPLDTLHIPTPGKHSVYWSMWEQDILSGAQTAVIEKANCVVVPTGWMRTVFARTVRKPIHIVPLGIAPEIFLDSPVPQTGPCIFGAAGCMAASANRKNLGAIVEAFQNVFRETEDVELRCKLLPGESWRTDDPRIRQNAELMSCVDLSRWFQGLTAFVNAGTEGWGLMVHQAMACGRPVIAPNYGGITAFFTPQTGYPVWSRASWCSHGNRDLGAYQEIDVDSLSEQMQRVYLDRKEVAEKGALSALAAREWLWTRTVDELERVLLAQ